MAIDFTLTPELEAIRDRVRAFITDVVIPESERIEAADLAETDRHAYVDALRTLRSQAYEAGLWMPHMPTEWGGMGLGHVDLAMVQAEAARTRLGPWVHELPGTRRGQHAHAVALGHRRAEGEVPEAVVRRHGVELLRHDRTRGRRLGPDADPDRRRTRTATSG